MAQDPFWKRKDQESQDPPGVQLLNVIIAKKRRETWLFFVFRLTLQGI